jgi:hypothetical protein
MSPLQQLVFQFSHFTICAYPNGSESLILAALAFFFHNRQFHFEIDPDIAKLPISSTLRPP